MASVLIFGASGQDGHYLTELYERRGWRVVGASRSGSGVRADVESLEQVEALVRKYAPDFIYQLAARSSTGHEALFENHRTIGTGTLNVLEAVYRWRRECKVLVVGSGLQFQNRGTPIHERDPFRASSSYAVERIHSVYAARYFRELGVRAYVAYLFHHESPLRKPSHVSQLIVQTARRIAAGSQEFLTIGDVTVEKEWGFAGDIAQGMLTLVEQDECFEAVIGTGIAHSIQEFLAACFSALGMDWREHTKINRGFQSEYARLVSNPESMRILGWDAVVGLQELANIMIRG